MKDELNQGLEFMVTDTPSGDGYAVNGEPAPSPASPGLPGRSKGGRPTLAKALGITDEEAGRRKRLAASLRVQRSKAKAKARLTYPAGSAPLEMELAAIDRLYDQKEIDAGLRKPAPGTAVEAPRALLRAGRHTGEGAGCRYVYYATPTGSFDLDVYVSDPAKPAIYARFPYRLPDLTKEQLDAEVGLLKTHGFTPTATFRRPLEAYVAEATGLIQRQKDGAFDLDEEDEGSEKDRAAKEAIREVRATATFGLVMGLLIQNLGREADVLKNGRGGRSTSEFFRLYDIIGDVPIPAKAGAFSAQLQDWIDRITFAPLKCTPSTGQGKVGEDLCSKKVIRNRLKMFRAAFKAATGVVNCFPAVVQAETILTRQKLQKTVETAERTGKSRDRLPYRSLYRREIQIIFESAPTLSHVAFFVLSLSTGLRPELLKLLGPRYYDPETGSLNFLEGMMFEARPGGEKKRISHDQESVVVRLILSFPEVFDIDLVEGIVHYYGKPIKKTPALVAFKKEMGLRTVARNRDFRTSCAQNLRQAGISIEDIAFRLGNTAHVAIKHYANTPPPEAKGVERGKEFYKEDLDLRMGGVNVCDKGPAWDGWLLKKFVVECIKRKRVELGQGEALDSFKHRLEAKTLAAYHHQVVSASEAKKTWAETHHITSLDDL